mmetsp:Transcript_13798/g.30063  ORF Transcript_13798/g.30063 Transcript_13798/m.30063 type:complete len:162 (+) Transcript_13798:120-605(+)|eukprot:CAMPEP_0206481872 /NCGR_PEP_ID=MMETSP0324_2-20121206/38453_1 /ASSEMBLY_ACC=CAM_ASM_000836 /TAXON_ID=2866 /ORGANISM="Crypthecodinium cohnii, Strain Seligo" /LENGTH=161 /DNA_ID=CAMNT_0053959543 /DNA_START=120 /DNA_END=605 /DNA_ORIENTATION=-
MFSLVATQRATTLVCAKVLPLGYGSSFLRAAPRQPGLLLAGKHRGLSVLAAAWNTHIGEEMFHHQAFPAVDIALASETSAVVGPATTAASSASEVVASATALLLFGEFSRNTFSTSDNRLSERSGVACESSCEPPNEVATMQHQTKPIVPEMLFVQLLTHV